MSTLTTIRPFEDIVDLFFNERGHKTPSAKSIVPAMNAKASDKELVLEFELPGYGKDEINVRLDERILTISAEKCSETKKEEEKSQDKSVWIRREINSTKFERKVTIPENIDVDNIHAENTNGILTLTLPKVAKEEKVINISVK